MYYTSYNVVYIDRTQGSYLENLTTNLGENKYAYYFEVHIILVFKMPLIQMLMHFFFKGLPLQNVVNLLDDYGEDPFDRYPSRFSGKEAHQRPSLSALKERHTSRARYTGF